MHLRGRRYLKIHLDENEKNLGRSIQGMFPELNSIYDRWGNQIVVEEIIAEVGYWRKANAVHQWFVVNVQNGVDDCRNYYVSRERMVELRNLCRRVLDFKNLAEELLPPQAGFFFGSTDCDEYYYDNLEKTIEILEGALALPENWNFEYHSSW